MQLLIIRHGQSANNLAFETTGWDNRTPDPLLTDLGHEQAAQLAQFFADEKLPKPDVLMTSLMRRAVQTVTPISVALDIPVEGHLYLNEVGGLYTGQAPYEGGDAEPHSETGATAEELLSLNPRLVLPDSVDETGWYRRGFESVPNAWTRSQRFLAEIEDRFLDTDKTIVAVSHGWFGQFIVRTVMDGFRKKQPNARRHGLPNVWFLMNNTAHAMLNFHSKPPFAPRAVVWMNRFDHLRPDQLTE